MNIASIIKSITGEKASKRTVAELRADLAAIDLEALERKVSEVERERRELLIRGTDAELAANAQALGEANLLAERGQALVDELTRLLAEAEARAAAAAVEQTAAGARAVRERLLERYVEADRLAGELADLLSGIVSDRSVLREAGREITEAGRADLLVKDPIGTLATHLGFPNSDSLVDPVGWNLKGYWSADGNGSPLKSERRLGRARELLAAPERSRKAA